MIKHDGIFLKKLMARHKWISKNPTKFLDFCLQNKILVKPYPKREPSKKIFYARLTLI